MLILIGVVAGLLWGLWAALVWGLRRATRVGPGLLLVVMVLVAAVYFLLSDAAGWPRAGSIAESSGAVTDRAGHGLLAGIQIGTAAVVVAVLVRTGGTRRLERWSQHPG